MKEKLKAAALRFVNEARAEQGKAPLSELPKGRPGNAYLCPVARGIGGKAAVSAAGALYFAPVKFLGLRIGERFRDKKADPLTAQFVDAFDACQFPELMEDDMRRHWEAGVQAISHATPATPDTVPVEWEREKALV